MMVTFVSQCEKNALKRTRRVLDAFANRIGDNTWQAVITQEGLNAVKKLLRRTASKSTAVSCHWIRSRARSELIWVVGRKDRFNNAGIVPVNSTRKSLMKSEFETDWKYLPLIKSLAGLSALLHDWGKASSLFQEKLKPKSKNKFKGDPLRHEWISVLLLNALVENNDDDTWLINLIENGFIESKLKEGVKNQDFTPLDRLPNGAKLLAWLIVSHHRLPYIKDDWRDERAPDLSTMLKRITAEWGYENKRDESEYRIRVKQCFEFPYGLLSESKVWCKNVKRWATSLKNSLPLLDRAIQEGSFRIILHHSRLCLMLGDHFYSSQKAEKHWNNSTELYANTDRQTRELKQKLDEHLVGVSKAAVNTVHLLPAFEKELPVATDNQALRQVSFDPKYKWQDKAVAKINEWQKQQNRKHSGFFAVNMASTGCGKTFANAKAMRALSVDGKSLRYILALGLRTLTLQTGDEYRHRIGLSNTELAVLIGSKAVAELHNQREIKPDEISAEVLGSESQENLLDEFIDYDCEIPDEGLSTVLTRTKDKQFLFAPVLACTIDHLMAATETKRGGRYILPSLRLMSSDLVIDEIDDFTGNDLIAIGRLIHLAGMLGKKVMISSATIPPDLALGYFNAYKKGWQIFTNSRENATAEMGCAWIDEFRTYVHSIDVAKSDSALEQYQSNHNNFIDKRVKSLNKQVAKRKASIIPCSVLAENTAIESSTADYEAQESKKTHYFSTVKLAALAKHKHHHSIDPKTTIRVSFGVIRVANISPCVELTRYLLNSDYPKDTQVRVMPYHSQQVLLLRHEQERHLDEVLKRKEKRGEPQIALSNSIIREHLVKCVQVGSHIKNLLFILVATPVEEVGRDHDFDWAVIEPSSYRSIIQLAGRVKRHRTEEVESANIGIMQYNLKTYNANDKQGGKYFIKPGYEDGWDKTLQNHDLYKLVNETRISKSLDAIPRIRIPNQEDKQLLAFIEHRVTAMQLTNFERYGANTLQGYLTETWYLTALPQMLTPFRGSEASTNLFLFYNENEDRCYFTEKDETGKPLLDVNRQAINRESIHNIKRIGIAEKERESLWLERDYQKLLTKYLSEPWLTTRKSVSLRYGEINIVERDNAQYEYSDQLGLVRVNQKGGK